MIERVDVADAFRLEHYETIPMLSRAVADLRSEARMLVPRLAGRRIRMVSSTARGGGVAEMLPKLVVLMRDLGLDVAWDVIGSERPEFFALTKRLHNMIHGAGEPHLAEPDRALYETVSRENAAALARDSAPDDLVVIHDPQPAGAGALLRSDRGGRAVWRCHIGLDRTTPSTDAAWAFLRPWLAPYDRAVFSATEYVPPFLAGRSTVVQPAIDPMSHKNRELNPHKLVGILCNSGLKREGQPVLTPPFEHRVRRLLPDGTWAVAAEAEPIGLLYRPVVAQVSRWDRLKGFGPLMEGFTRLKLGLDAGRTVPERHRRRLELVRLVLAGPEPGTIQDDPEARDVLDDLGRRWLALPERVREDVAVVTVPMASRKENALTVNALQRCATVAVQNSIQEGFGLTVTEAMWKHVPVLGTRACGIRHQIRDGVDGVLVDDPADPEEVSERLDALLADPVARKRMGASAQRRAHDEFLVFGQVARWLRILAELVRSPEPETRGAGPP